MKLARDDMLRDGVRENLAHHRRASQHTCDSDANSFQVLFEFASRKLKVQPCALMPEQLDAALVSAFLEQTPACYD